MSAPATDLAALRASLREKNEAAWEEKETPTKKLDSSLKKVSAFKRRVSSLGESITVTDSVIESLLADFASLNLRRYVDELAETIACKLPLKNEKEVSAALQLASAIHRRYDEFADVLKQKLLTSLNPSTHNAEALFESICPKFKEEQPCGELDDKSNERKLLSNLRIKQSRALALLTHCALCALVEGKETILAKLASFLVKSDLKSLKRRFTKEAEREKVSLRHADRVASLAFNDAALRFDASLSHLPLLLEMAQVLLDSTNEKTKNLKILAEFREHAATWAKLLRWMYLSKHRLNYVNEQTRFAKGGEIAEWRVQLSELVTQNASKLESLLRRLFDLSELELGDLEEETERAHLEDVQEVEDATLVLKDDIALEDDAAFANSEERKFYTDIPDLRERLSAELFGGRAKKSVIADTQVSQNDDGEAVGEGDDGSGDGSGDGDWDEIDQEHAELIGDIEDISDGSADGDGVIDQSDQDQAETDDDETVIDEKHGFEGGDDEEDRLLQLLLAERSVRTNNNNNKEKNNNSENNNNNKKEEEEEQEKQLGGMQLLLHNLCNA
ncbi:MAG: hypothetical protein MHM6MM_008039, partial [Cercozoa sp. M6MM]